MGFLGEYDPHLDGHDAPVEWERKAVQTRLDSLRAEQRRRTTGSRGTPTRSGRMIGGYPPQPPCPRIEARIAALVASLEWERTEEDRRVALAADNLAATE